MSAIESGGREWERERVCDSVFLSLISCMDFFFLLFVCVSVCMYVRVCVCVCVTDVRREAIRRLVLYDRCVPLWVRVVLFRV